MGCVNRISESERVAVLRRTQGATKIHAARAQDMALCAMLIGLQAAASPLFYNCSSAAGCASREIAGVRQRLASPAWHGQVLQDCFAQILLQGKRGGYFLDLASNDPIRQSNTVVLERSFG